MNLREPYWYFQSALSDKFCNELIQHATSKQFQIGITGGTDHNNLNKKTLKELKKRRDSEVIWLNDQWIYNEILPYVHTANKNAGWNFDIDSSEMCQFTKYGLNQYYHWHCDDLGVPYDSPTELYKHNKIRKLSVTISLSNPKDYKGGELEFNFNNPEKNKKQNIRKCTEILPRGSIVVFPSFVWHRVCPVKQGTRYSLVIWNLGYPYQ
jgi:PKHD-type hydroxylase